MTLFTQKTANLSLTTVLPALLIVALTGYIFTDMEKGSVSDLGALPGDPLAAYTDIYPIKVLEGGRLTLDKDIFMKAVDFLSKNHSPKAIADLIYVGQSNNISLLLNQNEQHRYKKLLNLPVYKDLQAINEHRNKMFQVYRDIVNGIGKTFAGTRMEIVLHDTRNPLQSVVAIQNPISGRRLGDSTTNFGIELIKDYSVVRNRGTNYVSYPLKLKDGRNIKSSTIPLYDDTHGLIGFICLNVDISSLEKQTTNNEYVNQFIADFVAVSHSNKIEELIENTKTVNTLAKN